MSSWIAAVLVSYIVGVAQSRYGTIASSLFAFVQAALTSVSRPAGNFTFAFEAVSWPFLATICIDELLVMKFRYVAAASAFCDFELIAHGRPSPPSVANGLPFAGGRRKKPTFLPRAFLKRAVCQLPVITKTPSLLPNLS